MKKFLLSLLVLASADVFAFTALTSEGAFKLNRDSKLFRDLSVGTQISGGNWMRAIWAYNLQGGTANRDMVLQDPEGLPAVLPQGAIVTDCLIDVVTPVTASAVTSTSIAFNSNAVGDLKALAYSQTAGYTTAQRIACIPVGTAATAVKMASEATLKMRIGSEALTNGRINLYVNYVISD